MEHRCLRTEQVSFPQVKVEAYKSLESMTAIKQDAEENRSLQSGLGMGGIASSSFQSPDFTSREKNPTGFQLCYKQYTVLYR